MNYKISDQAIELNAKLEVFMEQYIYPHEKDYDEFTSNQDNLWQYPDWYEGLKNEEKNKTFGIYSYQKNTHHGVLDLPM